MFGAVAGRFGVLLPLEANDFSRLQNFQTGYGAHLGGGGEAVGAWS